MSTFKYIPDSIDVKLKATHFSYVNKNAVLYTDKAANKGIKSWTDPYKRPQLVGHDKTRDPIGRIIKAEIVISDSTTEPPNYIQLTSRITDKDAIEKIMDGRYYSVSVGSRSSRVICSECSTVISEEGLCEHKKGSIGDNGRLIYWIIDEIEYVENSFVNDPADEYAGIEEINIGNGFISYSEFLDNKTNILINMEDHKMSKLTKEQREELAINFFCGPGRTFPAHDENHVKAGLSLLEKSEFSDSTKAKIKASLYRRGKRFGIVPTNDELEKTPDLLTARINDEFTEEEVTAIQDYFKSNPDSDLPEIKDDSNDSNDSNTVNIEDSIDSLDSNQLKEKIGTLTEELRLEKESNTNAIQARDSKIARLEKEVKDSKTLILQKDEEIFRYIDDNALLTKKYRDSLISNIIDLKVTDNTSEERTALLDKYSKRKTESLLDTLEDSRIETTIEAGQDTGKVDDPTIINDDNSDKQSSDDKDQNKDKNRDKYSLFDRDRTSKMEVE